MIGTISLVGLAVLGFLNVTPFWIAPFVVVNTLIGMYTPVDKMHRVREMGGTALGFFLKTLPLQAVFAAVIFGVFYFVGFMFG